MFKDKKYTAIITGGSRGVGAAAAKKLASHGWNVLITCSSSIDEARILLISQMRSLVK